MVEITSQKAMELVWPSEGASVRKRTSHDKSIHSGTLHFTSTDFFSPCSACRARKKRCYHATQGSRESRPRPPSRTALSASSPLPLAAPARPVAAVFAEPQSDLSTRESSPVQGRVSEYDPESVLQDLSNAHPQQSPITPHPRLAEHAPSADRNAYLAYRAQQRMIWYERHKRRTIPPKLSDSHRRYLEEAGAFLQLPQAMTDALLPIYISLLDDLIPVVDGQAVFRDYSNGQSSIYLVRAMCLVACKAKQAAPFLRLGDGGSLLEPLQFSQRLLEGLDAAMKADLEPDRVTKVRILALMHLHNDGPGGLDRSSSYLSQAISEAWAMCLHWQFPRDKNMEECDYLFWSLRNLDRLNKPIMGASPFLIDDSDIGIGRIVSQQTSYRSQVMGLATALGDLMITATKVYKASSTVTVDDCHHFPSLEDLISGTDFHRFHQVHKCKFLRFHEALGPNLQRGSLPRDMVQRSSHALLPLQRSGHGPLSEATEVVRQDPCHHSQRRAQEPSPVATHSLCHVDVYYGDIPSLSRRRAGYRIDAEEPRSVLRCVGEP